MKKLLFILLVLLSQPGLADLYKCSAMSKTTYQDKPCQTTQTQIIIAQQPYKLSIQPVTAHNAIAQIERDAHGKIKRSEKAKNDFKAANPCPANGKRAGSCLGYVIDHVMPLACGGADSPENMQWQTISEGKEKDGWERDNCDRQTKYTSRNQSPPDKNAPVVKAEQQSVYTGRRGGRYVITPAGKKHYLDRR